MTAVVVGGTWIASYRFHLVVVVVLVAYLAALAMATTCVEQWVRRRQKRAAPGSAPR